jgi:hypothetical protein
MDDRTVTTISAGGADTRRMEPPHCTVVMCLSRRWGGRRASGRSWLARLTREVLVGLQGPTKKRRPREALSDDGVLPPAPRGQRGGSFPHRRTVKPNAARSSSRRAIEWPRTHHLDRTALPSCARASRIWTGDEQVASTVRDIGRARARRPSGGALAPSAAQGRRGAPP